MFVSISKTLVKHNIPRDASNGRNFEDTLFGAVLSVSSIVKNEQGPYDFFDRPSRYTKKEHDLTEQSIHQVIMCAQTIIYLLSVNHLMRSNNIVC
jgi:hypothetical protein